MSEAIGHFNILGSLGELLLNIQFTHSNNCLYSSFVEKSLFLMHWEGKTSTPQGVCIMLPTLPSKSRPTMWWSEEFLILTVAEYSDPRRQPVQRWLSLWTRGGLSFLHHHPLTGYFVTSGPYIGWPGNNGTWLNTEVCLSIIFTNPI